MKKINKILLGSMSVLTAVATPIITVVSCGKKKEEEVKKAGAVPTMEEMNVLKDKLNSASKPITIDAYKAELKTMFGDFAKDSKGAAIDTTSIDSANSIDEITKAGNDLIEGGIYAKDGEEIKAKPTKVTFYGKSLTLDGFVPKVPDAIITQAGNAKVPAKASEKLDGPSKDTWRKYIWKLTDKKKIIETFNEKFVTKENTKVDTSKIKKAKTLNSAKQAAVELLRNVYTKKVAAIAEKETIVTINGKNLNFKKYVNITSKTVFVEEPGHHEYKKHEEVKDLKLPKINTLVIYKESLIKIFDGLKSDIEGKDDIDFKSIHDAKDQASALAAAINIIDGDDPIFKI